MTDELKSIRLQMVIAPSQVATIDAWRKVQQDLPSRSEAIRRLVEVGVKGERFLRELRELLVALSHDAMPGEKIFEHIAEIDEILGPAHQ